MNGGLVVVDGASWRSTSSPTTCTKMNRIRTPTPPRSPDLKSNGFYPIYMSSTARHDIVDHMNSHYRRLNFAKATVDSSPPKSYLMSRRLSPSPGGSTRSTSRASSASRQTIENRTMITGEEDENGVLQRSAIVRTSSRINYYLDALRREQQRLLTQVESQNAYFRRQRPSSNSSLATNRIHRRPPPDLLDRHAQMFTSSNKPFVPRLLRSTALSRLPEYRWYNPPRMKSADKKSLPNNNGDEDVRSISAASSKLASDASGSRRQRRRRRRETLNPQRSTDEASDTSNTDNYSSRSYVVTTNGSKLRAVQKQEARNSTSTLSRMRPVVEVGIEEDESKYLEFVVDVTSDILARGIFTNKVLKRVFRHHSDKRKGSLKMDKMEMALRQLQEDLGIPDTDDGDGASFGYGHQSREPALTNGNHVNNKSRRSDSLDQQSKNGLLNGLNELSNSEKSSFSSSDNEKETENDIRANNKLKEDVDEMCTRRLSNLLISDDNETDVDGGRLSDAFFEDDDRL